MKVSKHLPNQNGFSLIIVITIIVVLAVASSGILYYQEQHSGEEVAVEATPTPTPTPKERDWKTYVNDEFLYSFRLPADWYIVEDSNTDLLINSSTDELIPIEQWTNLKDPKQIIIELQVIEAGRLHCRVNGEIIDQNIVFSNSDLTMSELVDCIREGGIGLIGTIVYAYDEDITIMDNSLIAYSMTYEGGLEVNEYYLINPNNNYVIVIKTNREKDNSEVRNVIGTIKYSS